ncbi:MAG: hypothetical protein P1V20_15685 [Verrucomicrobiales bacterium]|nr:hypothetical protein [Verrucomicrobiales bacterium]
MKKKITWIIGILALLCVGFVVSGAMKAAALQKISDAGMSLVVDTANTSDFDAKLYEIAYSSPVAADKIGLWLEAVLAREFETFSTEGKPVTEDVAGILRGWPLSKVVEIDLSGSSTPDKVIAKLDSLKSAEWIDLSGTPVTKETLLALAGKAPNLRKLEVKNTSISWDRELVETLLKTQSLEEVVFDENTANEAVLKQLRDGLAKR